jgi:Tol biopolymer transport system component
MVTFERLTPGDHTFRLSAFPEHCTATGTNPRTVTAERGRTVTTQFDVVCVPRVGHVRVITSTTGVSIDPDGYNAFVAGTTRLIPANGSQTFDGVPAGLHSVTLTGIARNCGDPTRSLGVSVPFNGTVDARFDIVCQATGSLRVTVATSGVDPDPDGYRLTLVEDDFVREEILDATTDKTFAGLTPGTYELTVDHVAANCELAGTNPRTVTIAAAATATTSYTVACTAVSRLAYVSDISGRAEIYSINSNGTGTLRLTNGDAANIQPAWSPDGSKIAFASSRSGNLDIYVMNANGTNPVRLTTSSGQDLRPTWSPDGTRIAFVSDRDGHAEVYVMNADGTAQTRLTSSVSANSGDPAWSPDGETIAFASDRDGVSKIYLLRLATSAVTRLTSASTARETEPAWSPDGSTLAYVRCAANECALYTARVDGSAAVSLVLSGNVSGPSWSPDGSRIAFTRVVCDYYYYYYYDYCTSTIWIVKPNGDALVQLTDDNSFNPNWRR